MIRGRRDRVEQATGSRSEDRLPACSGAGQADSSRDGGCDSRVGLRSGVRRGLRDVPVAGGDSRCDPPASAARHVARCAAGLAPASPAVRAHATDVLTTVGTADGAEEPGAPSSLGRLRLAMFPCTIRTSWPPTCRISPHSTLIRLGPPAQSARPGRLPPVYVGRSGVPAATAKVFERTLCWDHDRMSPDLMATSAVRLTTEGPGRRADSERPGRRARASARS